MFDKLISKSKNREEDLIKELTTQVFNLDKITKIYSQLDVNLNSLYFKDEHILHYCCKKNLFQSVVWLLEQNIDTEIENSQKETAVFYAIHARSTTILQVLIEHEANLNHLNIYNRTALQDAVISANNRIVNFLIEVTKDLGNCDIHGNNLIFDAVANGNLEIIKKIASRKEIDLNQINEEGNSVLHKETVLKNNLLAMLLMDYGANPTILDKNGKNFLFHAISKGINNLNVIEKAVTLGCNINGRNSQNKTLLMESINYYLTTSKNNSSQKKSHFEMIQELIRLGVNVKAIDNNKENILFMAIKAENKELINLLIENAVFDFDQKNIDEKCVIEILIDIVLSEDIEYQTVLENLLRNCNVNINKLNSKGEPLFFKSILHFNFKLFKLLRIKDINLNQKDKDGNNILFKLMENNYKGKISDKKLYLNTIKSLINSGLDINAKNNEGLTALHIAVGEKCEYTIRLLLELRADCLATDTKGRTIIHNCIWKNTTKYFKLLHQYNKESINIPDAFGIRPINYAAFMGKKDLVIEMLDKGALLNNPTQKDPKILIFLEKFHPNILNITKGVDQEVDKVSLKLLADNMIKEFNIKI